MTPPLEVCASSLASAIAAKSGGASRIELCSSLEVGGITPSIGLVKTVSSYVDLPIHVLIRPRSGDFVYSKDEIEIMKSDIKAIGRSNIVNASGIVIGVLNDKNEVHVLAMKELVDVAKENGLSVTFHRGFDDIEDWEKGLEDVIELGCERILTSGGGPSCADLTALYRLRATVERANGRISIMVGGGINEHNVRGIVEQTGVNEVHASCKKTLTRQEQVQSQFAIDRFETDEDSVRRLIQALSTVAQSNIATP